jgi:hypothetical protein
MEEELLNELKTQLEINLRSLLTDEMKKSQNISYSLKRLAILNTAATFWQNFEDSHSNFKSRFDNITKNGAISQVEYNLIIDKVIDDILEEFIDGPNDYDKDNYDKAVWLF